jgi:hypothetical protein
VKRFTLILAVALALIGCTPAANVARDLIERADGASVTMLTDGVGFDSGASLALGVILIAVGDDLALVAAPEGASCTLVNDLLDCRLGDVAGRTVVLLTGTDVLASATFRREGASQVYQAFGR